MSTNPAKFRSAYDLARYCEVSYLRMRKLFQDEQGESSTAMIWRLKTDQAVHGNDFWETSFDPESKTYTLTYNLPLDGKTETTWFLKKIP